MSHTPYQIGLWAQLACIWEASARKAGNVHRFIDFSDTSYLDFLASAAASAPALAAAPAASVGDTVHECVRLTTLVARTNTNLGISLLLAPLAKAAPGPDLRAGVEAVLAATTVQDAERAYEAIRLAQPGGLGQAPEQDVRGRPTVTLRQAMQLAGHRDLVARQYDNGFADVFDSGVPALGEGLERTGSLEGAIVYLHLRLLAHFPDTLIARKCSLAEAEAVSTAAGEVLKVGWPLTTLGREAFAALDARLRQDGHRRNPGATADLVAACLFVALWQGVVRLPPQVPWALP